MQENLRVGSLVKIINCDNVNILSVFKKDIIGREVEIKRLNYNTIILKGWPGEWSEKNIELVKQISLKNSMLREVENELEIINRELLKWNDKKEKLLKRKEQILSNEWE